MNLLERRRSVRSSLSGSKSKIQYQLPDSNAKPAPSRSTTRATVSYLLSPLKHWVASRIPWVSRKPRSRGDVWRIVISVSLVLIVIGVLVYICVNRYLRWTWLPKYSSWQERNFRRQRFPSVEDRVRIYMTNWYKPPCDPQKHTIVYQRKFNETASRQQLQSSSWWPTLFDWNRNEHDLQYYEMQELESESSSTRSSPSEQKRTVILNNHVEIGRIFTIDRINLYQCSLQRQLSIRFYCSDATKSILNTAVPDMGWNITRDDLPILCQFSDETDSFALDPMDSATLQLNPRIPHIKKIRRAMPRREIDRLTLPTEEEEDRGMMTNHDHCHQGPRGPPMGMTQMQPIIWLLNINRHFKYSWDINRYDIPWDQKKDATVFRGLLTGLEYNPNASDEENCRNLIRCQLVYQHINSKIVDAKLTSTFDKVPEILHGVNLTGNHLKKEEMLQYKGFIILEGNDVSSGLKWAMVSKSVVLMPPPRITSWSMEELLEPWIHYIPIRSDLADVEEKTQWMLDHQAEAQRISHRANLWILDLYYHPDAMKDNRQINSEVLRRYRAHFRPKY